MALSRSPGRSGSGRGRVRELVRRALYGINAARRVARKVAGGEGVREAFTSEKPNLDAHRKERKRREAVDRATEAARDVYGDTLGWYLGEAEKHCTVCPTLAGNNFSATNPPSVGLPGQVHGNCACFSGPPHSTGQML